MQPQIHLVDDTWIDAPPETVSAVIADPANWRPWWPTLDLSLTRDRGLKGLQFAARSRAGYHPLAGSAEIWLEPFKTGVILHHFVRLDPVQPAGLSDRQARRHTRELAWQAKRVFWQLKDELESAAG